MNDYMRFILHGWYDSEETTLRAKEILDNRKINYRLELEKETDSGEIELIGPMGRLIGLDDIKFLFG